MTDGPMGDELAEQYERWPYPPPLHCMDHPLLDEARIPRQRYWPRGGPVQPLEVLIAGCGSREAALVAYYNPEAHITGVDVSATSLRHERRLKADYDLTNLDLHHLPVEQVAELGRSFDLIHCHGVLHHLKDPSACLRALRQVLRVDGSLSLMVYGTHGRAGVRMLSSLFRRLGLEPDERSLAVVRGTTAALAPHHPAHRFLSVYGVVHDTTYVDTFLNRRDVDYTVEDLLTLIESTGLRFQRWVNNEWYYPESHLPPSNPLVHALQGFSEPAIWQAMELFHATTQHYVVACRDDRAPERYRLDFDAEDLTEMIPMVDRGRLRSRGFQFLDMLNPLESSLFRFMDGRHTVAECAQCGGFQADSARMLELARELTKRLWRMGLLDLVSAEGSAP